MANLILKLFSSMSGIILSQAYIYHFVVYPYCSSVVWNKQVKTVITLLLIIIFYAYRQTSDINRAWVGNTILDHLDVVGASPVGTAPTTSSFSA